MALTTCRECGKSISTGAKLCPHCGARKPALNSESIIGKVVLAILGLAVTSAIFQSRPQSTTSHETALSSDTTFQSSATAPLKYKQREECNRSSAKKVIELMGVLGSSQYRNGKIEYKFESGYDGMTAAERRGVITAYADADACLSGKTRAIYFYRRGKLVGKADPNEGVTAD